MPPLMRDEFPSIYDETKYAVRPAGSHKSSIPYFYVNANEDHVDDPLAHLGCGTGMAGRSWNFKTKMRPGYDRGPHSKSERCGPEPRPLQSTSSSSTGQWAGAGGVGAIPSPLATVTEGVGARPSAQVPSLDHFPKAHATGGVISLSGVMAMTIAAQTLPTTSQLVICTQCGNTWTIDDMDRDWHTPTYWCSVCDIPLPTPQVESTGRARGRLLLDFIASGSLSKNDGGQRARSAHQRRITMVDTRRSQRAQRMCSSMEHSKEPGYTFIESSVRSPRQCYHVGSQMRQRR